MEAPLDLQLTIPADPQWAGMVRDLAAQAARHCGRTGDSASAFGRTVEQAVREACTSGAIDVRCVFRCTSGPLEVIISSQRGSRTLALD